MNDGWEADEEDAVTITLQLCLDESLPAEFPHCTVTRPHGAALGEGDLKPLGAGRG